MSIQVRSSQNLLACLTKLELPDHRSDAKMELMAMTSEWMPEGKPKFRDIICYPMIKQLVATEGRRKMMLYLTLLVKDFCSALNVVRNMNEDQMIDAAAMLLDECGDFRMEDYLMMFSMAKKGKFHPEVKIMDRIDIQLISQIMDAYWMVRHEAGKRFIEEEAYEMPPETNMNRIELQFDEKRGYIPKADESAKIDGLAGAISDLRAKLSDQTSADQTGASIQKLRETYGNDSDAD